MCAPHLVSGWSYSGEPSDFHVQLAHCIILSHLMHCQDERGETALFAACHEGRYDPAALLIDHGANVNYLSTVRPLHVCGEHDKTMWSV